MNRNTAGNILCRSLATALVLLAAVAAAHAQKNRFDEQASSGVSVAYHGGQYYVAFVTSPVISGIGSVSGRFSESQTVYLLFGMSMGSSAK